MSDASLPLLPVDPREVGPIELVRIKHQQLKRFVDDNTPWVILGTVALIVSVWHLDVTLPEVPNWGIVALIVVGVAAIPTGMLGWRLGAGLWTPDTVLISEQNAVTGDQRLINIEPDRLDEMAVLSHNEREKEGVGHLHTVTINGREALEVDRYHEEENVAIASWQAGVTNSEIRQDRARINYIKNEAEEQADKALELLVNHPHILREQTREVSNRIIEVAEGVEVPEGGQLHETLTETLEENDPSETLLDQDGDSSGSSSTEVGSEVDLDADSSDIFQRAEEMLQNGQEARRDD